MRRYVWMGFAAVLVGGAAGAATQGPGFISLEAGEGSRGSESCAGFAGYEQPLNASANASTSDAEDFAAAGVFEVADASAAGGVIGPLPDNFILGARIWGLSLEFDGGFVATCTADNATAFNVNLYQDAGGLPGALVDTLVATPTVTDTGIPFAFTTIMRYDFNFAAPIETTDVRWLGFQRQTGNPAPSGNACVWLFNDTIVAGFDGFAAQATDGVWAAAAGLDRAMCLALDPVPVELQSFDVD